MLNNAAWKSLRSLSKLIAPIHRSERRNGHVLHHIPRIRQLISGNRRCVSAVQFHVCCCSHLEVLACGWHPLAAGLVALPTPSCLNEDQEPPHRAFEQKLHKKLACNVVLSCILVCSYLILGCAASVMSLVVALDAIMRSNLRPLHLHRCLLVVWGA